MRIALLAAVLAVPCGAAELRGLDRLTGVGPAVFSATVTVQLGLTASSGTFSATGAGQYSVETASGIKVNGGGVIAPFFAGDGSAITGFSGTDNTRVLKAGDTMTGSLTLSGDPSAALHAAPKQYVDSWIRACVNPGDSNDIMVPVGALCVDKYEASVWSTPTGGTQYGAAADDYICLHSGQDCASGAANPIYARSVSGVTPSRYITWFQAAVACANAGKHLLTNAQWQAAAAGTPDPGAGVATPPGCNVNTAGPSTTGANTSCLSGYGAENMVGSLKEWVADWGQIGQNYNGAPTNWSDGNTTTAHWPDASYGSDASLNVAGRAWNNASFVIGMPTAWQRGEHWAGGTYEGVFELMLNNGPVEVTSEAGFRCGRYR